MACLDQRSVMRYLGPDAEKPVTYGVAAVSGAIVDVRRIGGRVFDGSLDDLWSLAIEHAGMVS